MMQPGLAEAQQGMGQGRGMQGQQGGIQQVVEMLRQGISPEELMQRGVPQEVIQAAMQILAQEQTAVQDPGLAGMATNSIV